MATSVVELSASKREVTGKKVKTLRKEGLVPAVLYGPGKEPLPLQVPEKEFNTVLAEVGGSQIININIDGKIHAALVRDVQRDNIRDTLIHVDLYSVSMDRLIRTEVPIEFINEPPLVVNNEAVLVTGYSNIEVECLPGALPSAIVVDLSKLVDVNDVIHVGDLELGTGVTSITGEGELIATLNYVIEEEAEVEEDEALFDADAVEVVSKGKDEEDFND